MFAHFCTSTEMHCTYICTFCTSTKMHYNAVWKPQRLSCHHLLPDNLQIQWMFKHSRDFFSCFISNAKNSLRKKQYPRNARKNCFLFKPALFLAAGIWKARGTCLVASSSVKDLIFWSNAKTKMPISFNFIQLCWSANWKRSLSVFCAVCSWDCALHDVQGTQLIVHNCAESTILPLIVQRAQFG